MDLKIVGLLNPTKFGTKSLKPTNFEIDPPHPGGGLTFCLAGARIPLNQMVSTNCSGIRRMVQCLNLVQSAIRSHRLFVLSISETEESLIGA